MAQQSLYRRYRPRRFAELKGQDHVVAALRNAVKSNREGQAYLFSGPRGTGKTSSARILAKVLNCERPVDGEPCCECASCLAVEAGTSFDVIELDAASNNKVDDIRELIERVNLGTPGRHKVYILDEVHMLTPGAEAALLKTLEEPPPHVVFVLATTDPQKVKDTIRSRTQHLAFHLLPAAELEAHVRWVAADAGIELSDDAVDAVVRQGAGSARDTLSALEVVAAGGGVAVEAAPLDEFVESLIEADPGRALAAVAAAVQQGLEIRGLSETIIAHLRECFLSLMAPELVQLPDARAAVVAEQAQRLGAAPLVRSMETIGDTLVEMRHTTDPRVLLEVALVKLTSPPVGGDIGALTARVDRLEQAMAKGSGSTTGPIPRPAAPVDPSTGRAVLGARARPGGSPAPPSSAPSSSPPSGGAVAPGPPAAAPAPPPAAAPPPAHAPTASSGPMAPTAPAASVDLATAFEHGVKPKLRGMAKALYVVAQPAGLRDGALVLTFPNESHAKRAGEHRQEIERLLAVETGQSARIAVQADAEDASGPAAAAVPPDEEVDLSELTDAAPADAPLSGISRIAAAFPGSELLDEPG